MRNGHIRFFVMDVDGTLTDGKIYMGNDGEMIKAFDIKDGCGICDILKPAGIIPVIITGRKSNILKNRCDEIGIFELHQGISDKLTKLREVLEHFSKLDNTSYNLSNVAYIGDDINDLLVMEEVRKNHGLTACPADAAIRIKDFVDFVSHRNGGNGAVREFIEYICY